MVSEFLLIKIRLLINRPHNCRTRQRRHLCKIIDMETILKHLYSHPLTHTTHKVSAWKKFITWCESQEKYRLGWLAVALGLHGCVLTIFTMFAVILAGNHFIFWSFV